MPDDPNKSQSPAPVQPQASAPTQPQATAPAQPQAAAAPPANTAENAKAWFTEATKDTKEFTQEKIETVKGLIDDAYAAGKPLVVDKDGKFNLSGLREFAAAKGAGAVETMDMIGKKLSEGGRAVYDLVAPAAGDAAEKGGNFLSNNAAPLGAALIAGVLGMALGEMGIIGAILLALLAFAVVGGLMGTGIMGDLLGGGTPAPQPQADGPAPAPALPVPALSKQKVVDGDKYVVAGPDEKPMLSGVATEVTFKEKNAAGEITGTVTGIANKDKTEFQITKIATALPDGKLGPAVAPTMTTMLDINSEGVIDLNSPKLRNARKDAADAAEEFAKPVELQLAPVEVGKPNIKATAGTTTVDGKKYTMVMEGEHTPDGKKAVMNKVRLLDDDNKPLTNSKGQAFEITMDPPVTMSIENSKGKIMSGDLDNISKAVGETLSSLRKQDREAVKAAQEKEEKSVRDTIGTKKDVAEASTAYGVSIADKLRDEKKVDSLQATMVGNDIARKYEDKNFRDKSADDAAKDIAALPRVQALGEDRAKEVVEDVRRLHKTATEEMKKKEAQAPTHETSGPNAAPATPALAKGTGPQRPQQQASV